MPGCHCQIRQVKEVRPAPSAFLEASALRGHVTGQSSLPACALSITLSFHYWRLTSLCSQFAAYHHVDFLQASGGFCQRHWVEGGAGGYEQKTVPSEKWSEAVGTLFMVLMFLQFWMWCFKIDFEYVNTPCPPAFLYPALTLLSITILTKRLCGTWHWNAGDEICWDIIAGSCTQEPKFRSEIATSSPLFPMETTPSAPQRLLSSPESPIRTAITLVLILLPLLLQCTALTSPGTTRFPMAAVYEPADDFFFNVVQQKWQLWQAYLGRVVIFTANFLDEDVFIHLSKWPTNRVGIAQLTQCCVFSRSSLYKAHRSRPSLRMRRSGKESSEPPRGHRDARGFAWSTHTVTDS